MGNYYFAVVVLEVGEVLLAALALADVANFGDGEVLGVFEEDAFQLEERGVVLPLLLPAQFLQEAAQVLLAALAALLENAQKALAAALLLHA